jgi:drug/metabolite transporter (DMT)-like permease
MFKPENTDGLSLRLKSDIALLFAAFLWGTTFVVQRMVAANVGVFLFNGLRFILAAAAILPFMIGRQRIPKKYFWEMVLTGLLLSAGAALQQAGLRETTVANAGFLTNLSVVMVPILLVVFWKERSGKYIWAAALIALAGAWLLSMGGPSPFNRGDLLVLAAVLMWSLQVIMVGRLSRRVHLLPFAFVQFLAAGVTQFAVGMALEWNYFPALAYNWWAVAYSGILSVAVGFSLQAYGQKHTRSADSAILMSMESVFAATFGYLLLKEGLGEMQLLGCGSILAAVILVQVKGNTPAEISQA